MRNQIITKLQEIEKEHQVKILYAVESGSRAWGFESTDSDYDVRFIYTHPLNWYLSIENQKDVIEYPVAELLDFSGWDLKKALQLYKKSNPPLYEWLNSPLIYLENGSFAQKLRDLMPQFYSPISCMYHYLHMAKGNYRDYLKGDIVRIKKYFYVLRPIFACLWIEKYNTPPPVEFLKTMQSLELDNALKAAIEDLYRRKKSGEELNKEKKIPIINDFLEEKIEYFEVYLQKVKPKQPLNIDWSILDTILIDQIT